MAKIENLYSPPVDQLLQLGRPPQHGTNVDYAGLGIGRESISELIRMATDEALNNGPTTSNVVWAPIHAWWALAELRAEEAIVPLLGLLRRIDEKNDDWVSGDLPKVFAKIGPAAIVALTDYLANPAHGEWARISAAQSLGQIAQAHPAARAECVAKLCAQLERFPEQGGNLNALLINPLLDLKATETAPMIERAFASGKVDEESIGDWEDAQIELGLKSKREHPRRPNRLTKMGDELRAAMLGMKVSKELENRDPLTDFDSHLVPFVASPKVGRNEPCPCGSGKKFKKCCGR